MSTNHPTLIDASTEEELRAERPELRAQCDALRLFDRCGRAACRKARACRGDGMACFDAWERRGAAELDAALKQMETAPLADRTRLVESSFGPTAEPAKPRARRA